MKFSVIVPLYNKSDFVVNSVNSILAQEFTELEVIVIDDGSTDNSVQRLYSIADPRLIVLQQSNSGVAVARNLGISSATGDFICFLDADDLWAPDHLLNLRVLIHEDPNAIAWATSYSEIDLFDCMPVPSKFMPVLNAKKSNSINHHDFMVLWARRQFLWTGSIAVRTRTLIELQPCFPVGEQHGEDQDLWFRLSERGHIRFIAVRMSAFYRRNVIGSLSNSNVLSLLPAYVRLLERSNKKNLHDKRAARRLFDIHVLHIAWNNCVIGRRATALSFLRSVRPTSRWTYWFRIFIFSLLPVSISRYFLVVIRRIGTNIR